MEFKHIEYFIEASHHKSMSQAAEALYISQQALSRCIQNLETELGCKLFHRTAKGSSLTEEGQYLYDQFAPLIESFRQKQEEAFSQISSRPQKITIASAPLMFSVLDTELLFSFKEQHPKMELDLKEMSDSEVVDYVDADASHLGIIADPRHHLQALFHFTEVKSYPICICINKDHPLASRESLDFGDLKDEKFIVLDKRSHYQSIIKAKAAEYGYEPNIIYESADVNQICNLINSGKGISIATDSPAFGTVFKNIVAIPLSDEDMMYSIAFIYQSLEKLEPQARKFIEFICKNM